MSIDSARPTSRTITWAAPASRSISPGKYTQFVGRLRAALIDRGVHRSAVIAIAARLQQR
jgi:hypothetical protein